MVTKVSAYERPMLIYGLSTDSKPTDVLNGSCFVEMDTHTIYFFDGEGASWLQWSGGGASDQAVVGVAIVGISQAG